MVFQELFAMIHLEKPVLRLFASNYMEIPLLFNTAKAISVLLLMPVFG